MTGVFTVHRGVFEHPLFDGEDYSRRDAWLWLVGNAAWKPTKVRVAGRTIVIERGQLAFSERFLAKKWGWSKSKVHRFFGQLKIEAMIELKADHETNQITICNYDNYQFSRTAERTISEPASGPASDQQRTKEEELNKRKGEAPTAPLFENASRETTAEADLFERGKKVLGADAGGLIVRLLASKKKNVALARAAIEQASTKQDPREYIGRIISGPAAANERHGINDPLAGIQ